MAGIPAESGLSFKGHSQSQAPWSSIDLHLRIQNEATNKNKCSMKYRVKLHDL